MKNVSSLTLVLTVVAVCLPFSISLPGARADDQPPPGAQRFSGNISWYGNPFHGRKTASGQIFDMNKLTSAHKKLPFFTRVLVENPKTGNTVIVSVTDRGPFVKTRVMDVSRESARRLGILLGGIAYVDCTIVGSGTAQDIK